MQPNNEAEVKFKSIKTDASMLATVQPRLEYSEKTLSYCTLGQGKVKYPRTHVPTYLT